jgi:AcrR family transcriptional regulator
MRKQRRTNRASSAGVPTRQGPHGRTAVRAAVVAAARDLFAVHGYAAVSVRDIAECAGVNHGLIHRHFGSKDEVLRAVLQDMFEDVGGLARARLSPGEPGFLQRLYPVVSKRKKDWQILMRAVLDGFDFKASGFRFPITAAVVAHAAAIRGSDDKEARIRAGAVIAGGLGWLLLETYLAPILDLEGVGRNQLRDRMAALYQELV